MGKYVIIETKTGFKFDLKAGNHETVASSEVYRTKDACINGVDVVRRIAPAAPVEDQTDLNYDIKKHPKFEVYTDKGGEYRFRLKAINGEIIIFSEGYVSKQGCLNGIDSVIRNADSEIKD